MENVKIITDSASDLPMDVIKQYDIDVLPLTVVEEDTEYKDGVTIMPNEVFTKMREGISFTTSQVTTHDYYQKFEEYILGDRPCIYVGFSSGLSGSFQASVLAKNQLIQEYGEERCKLRVIDTKCASLGFGLVVLAAAKEAKKGKNLEELCAIVQEKSAKMAHVFTVMNLTYLQRGGRLSKGAAVIGNLLNVCPILNVDDEGKLKVLEVARGNKKLFKRILEIMRENGEDLSNQTIGIVHGDDLKVVEELKGLITEKFGTQNFIIRSVGSVIGAHTGPEVVSVFYLKK